MLTGIPTGVIIAVAEEARWVAPLTWRVQHMEGFQHQKLLPVCLQRCTDCHQEEEVSGSANNRIHLKYYYLDTVGNFEAEYEDDCQS